MSYSRNFIPFLGSPSPPRLIPCSGCAVVAWLVACTACQIDDDDGATSRSETRSLESRDAGLDVIREQTVIHLEPEKVLRPAAAPEELLGTSCVPEDFVVPLALSWMAVPDVGLAENVSPSALELRLQNNLAVDIIARLRFTVDAATRETWTVEAPEIKLPAGSSAIHEFDLHALPLPVDDMRTSGMVVASASVVDENTGKSELSAASPPLFWHYGTRDSLTTKSSRAFTVYDELTLEQICKGGDLTGVTTKNALDPLLEGNRPIVLRVFSGEVAIVTQGKTTPQDLVKMGLLEPIAALPEGVEP